MGFLSLDLLLVGLLFVPAIQTFVVNKITQKVNETWGTEISIRDVRLTPTLRIVAHGVRIQDDHNNDMIYVEDVNGRLKGIRLSPFTIKLGSATFGNANVVIRQYEGDTALNILNWAKKFYTQEVTDSEFIITARHLNLVDSRFVLVLDYLRKVYDFQDNPPMDYGYFELRDIKAEADNFILDYDSVAAKFKHLSFNQYSGFILKDAQCDFSICSHSMRFDGLKVRTEKSRVDGDLSFTYNDWYDYVDFLDSVRITAVVRPSVLSMSDVGDFVGELRGMSEVLLVSADRFDGCVNDFHIINFLANCGYDNRLHGDLALKDITNLDEAYINLQLDSCKLNIPELALLTLPGGKKLTINKNISEIGQTYFGGSFVGTLTDFNACLHGRTDAGSLNANLSSLVSEDTMHLTGDVSTEGLNLAKLSQAYGTLGNVDGYLAFEGSVDGTKWSGDIFKTLQGHVDANVTRIDLLGYPLRHITLNGDYKDKFYNLTLNSNDPHLGCDILAQLDMTDDLPTLQGNVSVNHADLGDIANSVPKRDSVTAEGLDKVVYILQKNPSLEMGFDNLAISLRGTNFDDVSGYVGCDNIRVYNNGDSLSDCRFRITSINTDIAHRFVVSSNIANASLETNYPLADAVDSIKAVAYNFFPTLIAPPKSLTQPETNTEHVDDNFYIKAQITTYRTYNVLKLIFPDLYVASNANVDVALYSGSQNDVVNVNIPFFFIRDKIRLHRLVLNGNSQDKNSLIISGSVDSLAIGKRDSKLVFDDISLDANSNQNSILYDISWRNDFDKNTNEYSKVAGSVNIANPSDIVFQLKNTALCLNEVMWKFNNDNVVHLQKDKVSIDNLVIENDSSRLFVHGDYSFKNDISDLNIKAEALDIALVNPLLSSMSCGGRLTADVHLRNGKRRVILGKLLADDFVFNEVEIGNLFLMAGWNGTSDIGFSGGFFRSDKAVTPETLSEYDYRQFEQEKDIFARIRGGYATTSRKLQVHTSFDTLNAGFLFPFLSEFSDHIQGTASGKLSFYATPDSTYFDGNVMVLKANMGVAALGTSYVIENQNIRFNSKGIFFDNMKLSDLEGNPAILRGSIRHKMFENMRFDLRINTPGIMVLNTPKRNNSDFYGIGYASGEVTITGTDKKLFFRGPNLVTKKGTELYLLVSSASSVSESNSIHFRTTVSGNSIVAKTAESEMKLDFDFTFNVTDEADVVLQLESIGGTLKARANGNFRLTYNDKDDLNLYGSLELHSGDFKFSLYNLVNSNFILVPGGSIIFDGPLENMIVHASAYKNSKTSLANVVPSEYLTSTAASNVNAYMHLNGEIMKNIDPTFSFELPNSSDEVRNIFYNAIDTTNKENMTKQFAYFMVTNNFMPENLFSGGGGGTGNFLSNLINNTLNNLVNSRKASFGVIYNQANETTVAEYGIRANANLAEERVSISTSVGYYDDRTVDASNNVYGDFTIEYNINKQGTWKLKAYTYIGERDENFYEVTDHQINYTAGVAMAYKQSFDSKIRRKIKMTTESAVKRKEENPEKIAKKKKK